MAVVVDAVGVDWVLYDVLAEVGAYTDGDSHLNLAPT